MRTKASYRRVAPSLPATFANALSWNVELEGMHMTRAHGLLLVVATLAAASMVAACTTSTNNAAPDASTFDAGRDAATHDAGQPEDSGAGDSASDAPRSCASLAALDAGAAVTCSTLGDAAAGLVVNNDCTESIDLWWVDYGCAEQFYQTVASGSSATQPSFVTHPWRLRLADAGRVVKEIPPLTGDTTVSVP